MSGSAVGSRMKDDFSLSPSAEMQVEGLEFLGVYHTKGLASFRSDGLLGLGPKKFFDEKYPFNKRVFVSEM